MHKNLNFTLRFGVVPVTKAGKVIARPVDQTPVGKTFRNKFGWFDSDITMLMKASESNNKSAFEALASRLQQYEQEPDNKKSIAQLFDEWKPAYIQTPSELQAWPAYLKDFQPDLYERLYGEEDRKFEASQQSVKAESVETNVESNVE